MDAHRPALTPSRRDAGLRRLRLANRVTIGLAVGLTGLFSDLAAKAFSGHPERSAADTRRAARAPQRHSVRSGASSRPRDPGRSRLRRPAAPPTTSTTMPSPTSTTTPSASAPAPAPTPAPAPVVSGGS